MSFGKCSVGLTVLFRNCDLITTILRVSIQSKNELIVYSDEKGKAFINS